jgi:hypothetical protein
MKFLFFIICCLFLFVTPVSAAEIFFGVQSQKIGLGKLFEVGVFIDTENEPVNTIAGKIKFSSELLELKEAREGDSIINFWIEKPKTEGEETVFSGIIPGGYIGQSGYLFSLIFETRKVGETIITTAEEQIFLNDGQGLKTSIKQAPLSLQVEENVPDGEFSLPSDSEKPEPFELTITQDSKIFGGKYFLVFAAQDKKSGIDHYEVQESDNKQPKVGKWIAAESPYVLRDQRLRSYVFVKAIDRAGNERISELEPAKPLTWYEKYLIWCIIISVIVFYIGKFLWKKSRNIRKT